MSETYSITENLVCIPYYDKYHNSITIITTKIGEMNETSQLLIRSAVIVIINGIIIIIVYKIFFGMKVFKRVCKINE